MAPTAAMTHAQSHQQPHQQTRRQPPKQRPSSSRLHARSHSSTKLAAAGLAFTHTNDDPPQPVEEFKARRRTKSVEDVANLRPHGSSASLNRFRPSSRVSNKHVAFPPDDDIKVAGDAEDDEWVSESGASSPTHADEGDEEDDGVNVSVGPDHEVYDETDTGRHTPVPDRSRTPTLRPAGNRISHDGGGKEHKAMTHFPTIYDHSLPPDQGKLPRHPARSPAMSNHLRPLSLMRPPSFASAVLTAPPVLDKQSVLSGPSSPVSEIVPESPQQAPSVRFHHRTPSVSSAFSVKTLPPQPLTRVRTTSTFSTMSGTGSRAIDALSRAAPNPYLISHFPHQDSLDNVHHLLPSNFVKPHLTVKRFWQPVDEAVARVRPALRAT